MNKLTKIGVSALCGSLAAVVSANAGSLSASGGATATYSSVEGTTTGNPLGMASAISFSGSGELDNGTTVTLSIDQDDKSAYSASAITMDVPGMGVFGIDQGAGGQGLDRIDDMIPTAWEETNGTAVGTGLNTRKNFDKKIIKEISKITKLPFRPARNKFAALAAHDEIM